MWYCIQCGSGLAVSGTCAACGFSRAPSPPPRQGWRSLVARKGGLWPLVPLLFSFALWAYHEYELNRSADAIRTSFDTIKANLQTPAAR
jgi:hypothetical protein